MKKFIKISILILISCAFLFLLSKRKIIDFNLVWNAFTEYKLYIFGIGIIQICNHISMALRYRYILKILGLQNKTENVISSTLISNSIGQWLPGSLAVIEFIRIGLMLKRRQGPKLSPLDKFHLTTASLFDRIIGLFVALVFGAVLTFYFILKMNDKSSSNFYILAGLFIFNFFTALFIIMLPIIAGSKYLQHILAKCERIGLKIVSHSFAQHMIISLFHKLNSLIKVFAENGKKYRMFWIPIGFSVISIATFTGAMHFAWLAIGSRLPFLETIALNSAMAMSIAVPISIGGIGAPQLITAVLYGALGADASFAASAQLLLLGVTLIAISICGLVYLPRIIKEIIKPKIA